MIQMMKKICKKLTWKPEAGGRTSRNQAITLRNRTASELWAQYQGVLHDREGNINESDDDEDVVDSEDGEFEGMEI